MQVEDITRLRQSEHVEKQMQIENEQKTLIKQLDQLIRQRTVEATQHVNNVLRQMIDLIKRN